MALLLALSGAALVAGSSAYADETGSGLYVPGYFGPTAGMLPPPGTYGSYTLYLYNGSSTANVSASGVVPIPGTDFVLPAQVSGSVTIKTPNLAAHLFNLTEIFPQRVFGGNFGLSATVPIVDARLNAASQGALTLTGPQGDTFTIPFNGERSTSEADIGDVIFTALLGWHSPKVHTAVMLNVYTPTGAYDVHRVLNVGKNHWGVEPMVAVTYLDPKTGIELSAAGGITFNATNPATDYRNGDDLHFDFVAAKHFPQHFYLGLAGYDYTQITGDSGSGAHGPLEGQVFGLGPAAGSLVPLGGKHVLALNVRYYWEMGARNRLQGQTLFVSAAMKFW